jgi:CRP/FNR family cyclic AMP-dependent transcriptional regulator
MLDKSIYNRYGATIKQYGLGEIVFEEGSDCTHYHELLAGKIRWTNIHEDGREFIHNIILEGESFGELPIFDGLPYAASAICHGPCEVLRIPKNQFIKCLKENHDLHLRFTTLFASRLRFKFLLSQEMAQFDPEHRICSILNYLRENTESVCQQCFVVKLTRQEIANMTGLRVETVIRTLKNMATQKKVCIIKGKVYLPNLNGNSFTKCHRNTESNTPSTDNIEQVA